jgi:muconolactone D-isomerase
MLFYASITVRVPSDANPERIEQLKVQEASRAGELEREGKWLHVWRVVGRWANVSIFDVKSHEELHEILTSLPLYPYMDIEVTPLCEMHPTTASAGRT